MLALAGFLVGQTGRCAMATWTFFRSLIDAILIHEVSSDMKTPPSSPLKGLAIDKHYQLPGELPTLPDIKRVLPKHCFQPSIARSMYYVVKDLSIIMLCLALVLLVHQIPNSSLFVASLLLYWFAQGTMFWAVFVLGHDCGHESFSNNKLLNDTMGTFLHSIILVPFYMWKLSHKHHHKNTGNIDKDEVFYPIRRHHLEHSSHSTLRWFGFGIGWVIYLFMGYRIRPVMHFNPYDEMFKGHVLACFLSLGGYALWLGTLYYVYSYVGFTYILYYYLVPILVFASYLVIVTFLHHTEVHTPWFDDSEWTNVKGQLSSVDRDYGIVHGLTHNIGTHQIHHLFSKIPHYYLEEATLHFRKAFPQLVRKCDEPILPSFLRMFKKYEKQFVIDDNCKVHKFH